MSSETLTYRELAERLGISLDAARTTAKRRVRAGRWQRWQGNDGLTRIKVPADDLGSRPGNDPGTTPGPGPDTPGQTPDAGAAESPEQPQDKPPDDRGTVAAYQLLVTELRTQLQHERDRAEAAERARDLAQQAATEAKLEAAELRGELASERRRLGVVLRDLLARLVGAGRS